LAEGFNESTPGPPNWWRFLLGLTHYRLGEYQEALDHLNRLPSPSHWFRPLFAMVHHQLGNEAEAERYLTDADAWYERAATDHLAGDEIELPVNFWFDWAYFVIMRREAARVVEGCDEWKDPWHHLIRGRVLLRMYEQEKAEREFQAALAMRPDNPVVASAVSLLLTQQGEHEQADAVGEPSGDAENMSPDSPPRGGSVDRGLMIDE
jgi:tetratricopeptide (TPR) repeat protein